MIIRFKKLSENAVMPKKAHADDAGFDLTATSCERIGLFKWKYGTGIAIELPEWTFADARPRSSIHKTGMILSNGCGTIDAGYRGEITAIFWKIPFIGNRYKVGDRIIQLLIGKVPEIGFAESDTLNETKRGTGGYGSTGR